MSTDVRSSSTPPTTLANEQPPQATLARPSSSYALRSSKRRSSQRQSPTPEQDASSTRVEPSSGGGGGGSSSNPLEHDGSSHHGNRSGSPNSNPSIASLLNVHLVNESTGGGGSSGTGSATHNDFAFSITSKGTTPHSSVGSEALEAYLHRTLPSHYPNTNNTASIAKQVQSPLKLRNQVSQQRRHQQERQQQQPQPLERSGTWSPAPGNSVSSVSMERRGSSTSATTNGSFGPGGYMASSSTAPTRVSPAGQHNRKKKYDVGVDAVDQLQALLFNPLGSHSVLRLKKGDTTKDDSTKITDKAALRMESVKNLLDSVKSSPEWKTDEVLDDDPLVPVVESINKFHRFITTLLANIHLSSEQNKAQRRKEEAELIAKCRREADDDMETKIEQLEAQVEAQELDIRTLRSEKKQMAKQLQKYMNSNVQSMENSATEPGRRTREGSMIENNLMSSVSFNPDVLMVAHNDYDSCTNTATPTDASGATPPVHSPMEDGGEDGEMSTLFTLHSNTVLEASIANNPMSRSIGANSVGNSSMHSAVGNSSVRSTSSQIKVKGLGTMERSRRKEMLSEKKWPYKLGNVIGTGAHGVVYLGLMEDTGETVAAKQVLFDTQDSQWENKVKNLQTEISVLRKIEHDNIVSYLFTDRIVRNESPGMLIFMEYVSGGSIGNILSHFGALGEKTAAIFTAQILLGLRHLHENNIVHRDIKPANCLLSPFGVVKLADFGTALIVEDDTTGITATPDGKLSQGSTMIGTPVYMAPETIRSEETDWRADIWSFGCTMMELLTGQQPWAHLNVENPIKLLHKVAGDDEPLPMPPFLSPMCQDLLSKCLAKSPAERFSCTKLLRHPWFENFDVLMLSFNQNMSTGSLQIRPELMENIGQQVSDSISQRPVNLGASVSVNPNSTEDCLAASISFAHARSRRSRTPPADAEVGGGADGNDQQPACAKHSDGEDNNAA